MKKNIEISPNIETLFGTRDENLRLLEDGLNVTINLRADSIEIAGAAATSPAPSRCLPTTSICSATATRS